MSNQKECTKNNTTKIHSEPVEELVCPVCKKVLPECDLPDKDGVIEDNVYYKSGIKIVNSDVTISCKFSHMHDEQENELDEPHGLIAVVNTRFNQTGKCTYFEIVEIVNQKKEVIK